VTEHAQPPLEDLVAAAIAQFKRGGELAAQKGEWRRMNRRRAVEGLPRLCKRRGGPETQAHTEEGAGRAEGRAVRRRPPTPDQRCLQMAMRFREAAHKGGRAGGVGDSHLLDTASISMGTHARIRPVRSSDLTMAERVVLDGQAAIEDAGLPRLGQRGWKEVSKSGARKPKTIRGYVRNWNIYVTKFCDPEGFDPWVTSPTVFELFIGYLYEVGMTGSADRFTSAINYIHKAHDLPPLHDGGRYAEAKVAFAKSMKIRRKGDGTLTYRALIPDYGFIHFLNQLRLWEDGGLYTRCNRSFFIIVKVLTWVRAITMGATEPGDCALAGDHFLFTVRRTRCGNEEIIPTQMSIPMPGHNDGNDVSAFVMGFLKRTLEREPGICAEVVGIDVDTAAEHITAWMREFMPAAILKLPMGAKISSHSSRDTGATQAKRSVKLVPWDTIMSWGGWLSEARCKGYIKPAQPSVFWAKFFYWLAPDYRRDYMNPTPGLWESSR
jgi:hypothetical protein